MSASAQRNAPLFWDENEGFGQSRSKLTWISRDCLRVSMEAVADSLGTPSFTKSYQWPVDRTQKALDTERPCLT